MNLETWENLNENRKRAPYTYQDGENKIRIVGDPKSSEIHWATRKDRKKQKVVCPGSGCPLCEIKNIAIKRYYVKCIVRSDQKGHVVELGTSIVRQILTCVNDPRYGNPCSYDLNIEKVGTGKETRYKVRPVLGKSSLTAEEQAMADALNLEDFVRPNTVDEIRRMQLIGIDECSLPDTSYTVDDDEWENITLR